MIIVRLGSTSTLTSHGPLRNNAYKTLGVFLIRGHFKRLENPFLLGSNFENPYGRWTKVTEIDTIELSSVYGHVFVLINDRFTVYE